MGNVVYHLDASRHGEVEVGPKISKGYSPCCGRVITNTRGCYYYKSGIEREKFCDLKTLGTLSQYMSISLVLRTEKYTIRK